MKTSPPTDPEAVVNRWNNTVNVGDLVRYWSTVDRRDSWSRTKTRSRAWVLPSGPAVVQIEGKGGSYALECVEPVAPHLADTRCRTLTVQQPHASRIASGEKWIENRSWRTSHRGPLYIHAGSGNRYLTRRQLKHYDTGAVVALVNLIACVHARSARDGEQPEEVKTLAAYGLTLEDLLAHEHAEADMMLWVLDDIRVFDPPVIASGHEGIWSWEPQRDFASRLVAARAAVEAGTISDTRDALDMQGVRS